MTEPNPVLVEVTRGPAVESIHRGAAAVADVDGGISRSWGDIEHPVYPRSSIKPLQAIPLLTTGAAAAQRVTPAEIALACASHNGETMHTERIDAWLKRIGLDAGALACGAHPPTDRASRQALSRQGAEPSPLHNNCSGKHTGFLTICRHGGYNIDGYIQPDHPVQRLVRDHVASLTGCDLRQSAPGVDGCGIPVYGIPLRGLATAMARIARPEALDPDTARAVTAIREAMTGNPYLVAGRGRFCTLVMDTLSPAVLVKTGAEGVFCAALLDRGLGIALKIDDGATRASEVALGGVLRTLGAIDDRRFHELRDKLEPGVLNVAGARVGVVRAASALAAS